MQTELVVWAMERLRTAGDPARAEGEKRYLKSERVHLGCGMPFVDSIARELRARDLDHDGLVGFIEEMWDAGVFESCMLAVKLAAAEARKLGPTDMFIFEQMVRESGGWALVDSISTGVIGSVVERFPAETGPVLDRWSVDTNFWVRRTSILALLKPLRRGEGDWPRFARYADGMIEEKEFFIRKAIGWVLREVSKERPDLVYQWVEPRIEKMSGVTYREARKYLRPEQQRRLGQLWATRSAGR